MTLMMEELDPNRHQQMWQFYDKETKEGGLGRVTFNKMFRGRPWYTVEARKDGDWTVVGEVRQRPKNKDGLEWAVYEDGKEVDRWHDFAHAAANVPGAANEDMSDRWAQKRRNEYKSGKRLRSKSPEFRGEVPPVVEIPKAEGTTNEKFEFIPSEAEIERAASEIDTEASEAQLRAGNAKKGHTKFAGFDITFEHRPDLKDDNAQYGYIKRTKGADGEQVDVFVNKKAEKDWAGDIYVVDQYTEDGNFDEHKVMLGYNNLLDAKRSYRKAYGRQANNITKLTQNEFKAWLAEAGSNKRPAIETSVTEAGRKERESGQNRLRFSSGKNLLATSDEEFIKAVLKTSEQNLGDMPDTMPLNIAVSELLTMQEREQAQTTSGEDITGAVTMDEVFPPGKIEKEVAAINKEFPGAEIILAERADPQIQARIADQLGERHSNVPALYDPATKTIYIFKDRLNPITPSIRKLALHEMVHKGLDNMFDAHNDPRGRVEYNELMDDIYERVPSKYKPLLKKIELEYELEPKVYPEDRRIAAEELVANLAERDVKEGIVARVIKFVRNFLERIGMITKEDAWTNEDIRKLIAEAHGAIEVKDRSNRVMLTEEVTVAETGEVYEVELPASELLNEIEQRKAMCEKVRACL
jgi:hypothetical protein